MKAKKIRPMVTTISPNHGAALKLLEKASVVAAAPSKLPLDQIPDKTRVKPVMVQMMMVSKKVPVIWIRPCLTQELVLAAAAAIGADPRPDSLEKTPLETPLFRAIARVDPVKPPTAARGVKALLKMRLKAAGTADAFNIKIVTVHTT